MRVLDFSLFSAAFTQIATNLGAALRIGLIPFVVTYIGLVIFNIAVARNVAATLPTIIVTPIVVFLTLVYSAVSWHRFALGRGNEKGLKPVLIYGVTWTILTVALGVAAILLAGLIILP